MKKGGISDLLIYVISAELAGAVSALLAGDFSGFFVTYKAPPLLPPPWLFVVVWVILYALMGVSAYIVHSSGAENSKRALTLYWVQLFVNFCWSIIFFRFEALWFAVIAVILLLALVFAMVICFRRINRVAGNINIPYLLWVSFASYLTIATALINSPQ